MGILSYQSYLLLVIKLGNSKISTILALGIAVVIYFIMLIILKVFSRGRVSYDTIWQKVL